MTFPLVQLRRIARRVNGGTPTPDEANWGGGIPWATPVDLGAHDGGRLRATGRTLTQMGVETGSSMAPADSVFVSTRAPIGYVSINAVPMAFNQGCRALIPSEGVDSRFLAYAIQHLRPSMDALGTGTTFNELSSGAMATLMVPAPSALTQRHIADFLDRETAEIDAVIAKQEELIAVLAERRRSVLDSVMRETDRADSVRMKYLFRPSGQCNAGGEQVLSVYRDHGVIPKASRSDNFNKTPENLDRYLLVREHDLVVNKMKAWQGSLGVSRHRGIVSPDYEVLRPTNELLLPRFAHYVLRSPTKVAEYGARSVGIRPAQWRLYWDQLGSVLVSIPERAEQHRLVARLDSELSQLAATSAKAEESITLMRERRAALISDAVTGRLDVDTYGKSEGAA